ncbi:MAG: hypothetical protein ACTHWJ_10210 [Flaviflexus sp.]|uniref:Uncharacterized protein n=1 Tax=Glutamicibacter arilaitensis TaxID=256701 RepID=A0A2N7S0U6_9MICC|nr:hypothetical protein CIK84_14040 [Glutamicibacter arilaitensis]HCJ55019.1 hypothetical protein [Glutamicibacter sp.]HCM95097.1 hypothetical protein [Glutamicibacter sp.]
MTDAKVGGYFSDGLSRFVSTDGTYHLFIIKPLPPDSDSGFIELAPHSLLAELPFTRDGVERRTCFIRRNHLL